MRQVEFKVRDARHETYRPRLEGFGAAKTFDGDITTTYYNNEDSSFMSTGKRLSMRTKGDHTLMTFKNKYSGLEVNVSDEFEVEVEDPLAMSRILEGMGFTPAVQFHKERVDYLIDDVYFSFDKYLGEYSFIPPFLMMESGNEAIILYWADELGIERKSLEAITVLDLIKEYKTKKDDKESLSKL